MKLLKLGEYLQHFIFYDLNIVVEELLDRVRAEVKEHRELFEGVGVSGFVDVDDVGKHLGQTAVNVMVKFPFNLAQEIPVNDKLIDIDQQLLADAFEKGF